MVDRDGKKVSIMEQDGKRIQTIECDKFRQPCGVATGPDGAIYVTDCGAGCLFKFNKEGRLLKTVQNELKGLKLLMRMGLCMYVITPLVIVRFLYSEMTSAYLLLSVSVYLYLCI